MAAAKSDRSLASRWWYLYMRYFCRLIALALYRIRVIGHEHVPRAGGAMVVSNHQCFLDPVFVGLCIERRMNFLARDTLFTFSPLGRLIASLNAIPLDREGTGLSGLKETLRRLKRGELVLIFPEGTRSFDGRLQPLKPGFTTVARRSGVPIVPVAIDGGFEAWPRSRPWPWFAPIQVEIGPPIHVDAMPDLDEQALLELVTARLQECLDRARAARARRCETGGDSVSSYRC
ncbi:MAG: 1-acyl-sn-glycerol-3-phosphate acyltransferase [Pirellulales bacterium]|nr:1-acyl-sn-glycerol-3-phosphate acyltransferase [Pirellulales bacterium]